MLTPLCVAWFNIAGCKPVDALSAELGYLFTNMAVGSVISGAFIVPWARARYSPQRITTAANLVLLLDCCLMVLVHRPFVFLVVAALSGIGWTLSASELWVASQRAMPDWASGRMNATMVMVAQAATALGGVIWGLAAHHAGVVPTFLGAAGFGLLICAQPARVSVAASAKAGSVFMVCIWRRLGQGCVIPAACTATVKATRTHALSID